jgi:hypothetical protein
MASASSSPDLSRVIALTNMAGDLLDKGHVARAGDKYGQAADAAMALPDAEDSLILATSRLNQARMLIATAQPSDQAHRAPNADALDERAFCVLLPAAMAALDARRTAGTLMPGRCRAAEVTWRAAHLRYVSASSHTLEAPQMEAVHVAQIAQYVGYEAFSLAAHCALIALVDLLRSRQCSAAAAQRAERMLVFVASALELAAQPRGNLELGLVAESMLLTKVQEFLQEAPIEFQRPLLGQWWHLQACGVLHQRHIAHIFARSDELGSAARMAAEAAASAPTLRGCALPSCGAREAHVSHFKLCAACKAVAYCCKAHQADDWARHKTECKAARAAAAAAAAQQP